MNKQRYKKQKWEFNVVYGKENEQIKTITDKKCGLIIIMKDEKWYERLEWAFDIVYNKKNDYTRTITDKKYSSVTTMEND